MRVPPVQFTTTAADMGRLAQFLSQSVDDEHAVAVDQRCARRRRLAICPAQGRVAAAPRPLTNRERAGRAFGRRLHAVCAAAVLPQPVFPGPGRPCHRKRTARACHPHAVTGNDLWLGARLDAEEVDPSRGLDRAALLGVAQWTIVLRCVGMLPFMLWRQRRRCPFAPLPACCARADPTGDRAEARPAHCILARAALQCLPSPPTRSPHT